LADALFRPLDEPLLEAFFDFRSNSITRTVQYAARLARQEGLNVGLDCFSPSLARMVGQDLSTLDKCCDWIKLMTYPRVFGPAGLPFELNALSAWMRAQYDLKETEASEIIARASDLRLSQSEFDSRALAHEIQRGRDAGVTNLFAGLALVEVEGVHHLIPDQVAADLAVCHSLDVEGVVLSWDLWRIPRPYLSIVGDFVRA
jgi:hypothetical protein